jgi:hypothetical protein
MMVWMRGLAALSVVVLIASLLGAGAACSAGLSASDSQIRCTTEQEGKIDCWNDSVTTNNCVSCYERCGNSCTAQATCPSTYLCPGDAPIDAGSD